MAHFIDAEIFIQMIQGKCSDLQKALQRHKIVRLTKQSVFEKQNTKEQNP